MGLAAVDDVGVVVALEGVGEWWAAVGVPPHAARMKIERKPAALPRTA